MRESTIESTALPALLELARRDRIAAVHHEHLATGKTLVRQFYTGTRNDTMHTAMDSDASLMRGLGATETYRTKIGRNASCPCGSGRKFKKCCLHSAQTV